LKLLSTKDIILNKRPALPMTFSVPFNTEDEIHVHVCLTMTCFLETVTLVL